MLDIFVILIEDGDLIFDVTFDFAIYSLWFKLVFVFMIMSKLFIFI